MPDTYALLREAILSRKIVTCEYKGKIREFCPHALGIKDHKQKVLVWQFAGESSSGLQNQGDWRCMFVGDISRAAFNEGDWRTCETKGGHQNCIDQVDVQVDL